jgi:hypothetical protein
MAAAFMQGRAQGCCGDVGQEGGDRAASEWLRAANSISSHGLAVAKPSHSQAGRQKLAQLRSGAIFSSSRD